MSQEPTIFTLIAAFLWQLFYYAAVTIAAIALAYFGVHFVYGRLISLEYCTLFLVGSYLALIFTIALRATEPFWRALWKSFIYSLLIASVIFGLGVLKTGLENMFASFTERDLCTTLSCTAIYLGCYFHLKSIGGIEK
jgi:hypothetical protein